VLTNKTWASGKPRSLTKKHGFRAQFYLKVITGKKSEHTKNVNLNFTKTKLMNEMVCFHVKVIPTNNVGKMRLKHV